jgi:hypothetical protein
MITYTNKNHIDFIYTLQETNYLQERSLQVGQVQLLVE